MAKAKEWYVWRLLCEGRGCQRVGTVSAVSRATAIGLVAKRWPGRDYRLGATPHCRPSR